MNPKREKMKTLFMIITLASLLLSGCGPEQNQNEDLVKQVPKDGSIEASLTTKHIAGADILTVEYSVWVKGVVDKKRITVDTLKSLGITKQENEDDEGNVTSVQVPKDYEFYITVK